MTFPSPPLWHLRVLSSPAALRNRGPILELLRRYLPARGATAEIVGMPANNLSVVLRRM